MILLNHKIEIEKQLDNIKKTVNDLYVGRLEFTLEIRRDLAISDDIIRQRLDQIYYEALR